MSDTAGVKSQMANFVAAMVTLSVIVWLLPHFSCMPKAVAASIIFVVAISLIDVHELLFCVRTRSWVDLGLLLAMSAVTFGLGVDIGIFFAFAACLLMAVKQTTLPGVTMLGRSNAQDDFHDLSDVDEEATNVEGILIYKVSGHKQQHPALRWDWRMVLALFLVVSQRGSVSSNRALVPLCSLVLLSPPD